MNTVGSLSVSARYGGGRLSGLAVRLERPPVTRIFLGRPPATVARLVPSLYTLCARAQSAAAQAALAAAAGEAVAKPDATELWTEVLHEHFWRLLLDWPLALGLPQAKEAFIAWRAARSGDGLAAATFELVENTLLGVPAAKWRAGSAEPADHSLAGRCRQRLENYSNSPPFDLPALTVVPWLPYWRGEQASEPTTALPASVASVWKGRLQQAVDAALALASKAAYPVAAAGDNGWGIGQTLTARGLLTHGARVEAGRVVAYQVWAPTDRHFADASGLAELLGDKTWPDGAAARQALEQAILALDPCLPYTLKVENA